MRSIKCTLDENEIANLTAEAQRLGVHRSELIRSKLISAPAATPARAPSAPTCSEYLNIVSSVRRRMGNSISPSQVEQCVAITLRCMHG